MNSEFSELESALITGFIDKGVHSKERLQPSLATNELRRSKCVLDEIIHELATCESFFISAAFLTKSGVAVLMNSLIESQDRGISGKILVSEYLGFTQPEALRALKQFDNVELRVATDGNMHGKAYLFEREKYNSIIIGSSNLTAAALKTNNEINLKVSATSDSSILKRLSEHLLQDFSIAAVANDAFIESYSLRYRDWLAVPRNNPEEFHVGEDREIVPTDMQVEALQKIQALRDRGENRALIISATGTGKTFLSAFDVRAVEPKKVLFVVHRKNIALAALKTFRKLFHHEKTYGIFSGSDRSISEDFIFATVQTISRDEHLDMLDPELFDYVIIDETHRAGAESYQKIIRHLQPKFLLGMTATPERTDGHDIFSDFHHNIAFEIRLHRALEDDILSPFHYFGVTDISVDGSEIDEQSGFNLLSSEERVNHVVEKAAIYGCDTGTVRGLIFCSRKDECHALSNRMNAKGLRTVALTGDSSEEKREEAIRRLESDIESSKIDYIITVDIFNEGIDIPRVNQILMLRPTSSAIVFVQQLGRGLRKAPGKDHLTVIDFIGNYQNNYLVPIALYGDTTYNKDRVRRLLNGGSANIPGSSTVNFDQISRKRIFDSIDRSNLSLLKDLKTDYNLLKYELGRVPMMMDFLNHGKRDPFSFVAYSQSYYQFVRKVDQNFAADLTSGEVGLLAAFSKEINSGRRVEDSIALKQIIENGWSSEESIIAEVVDRFGYTPKVETISSVFRNIALEFVKGRSGGQEVSLAKKLGFEVLVLDSGRVTPSEAFGHCLRKRSFKKFLHDSTGYSIEKWAGAFSSSTLHDGFILYEKYSRKDVFRILNWEESPNAQNVGGYQMSRDKKDIAIFVNYEKSDHSSSTKYEDEFIDEGQFQWMSKNQRYLSSPEIVQLRNTESPSRLPLFVKKSNDEGLDFYYMGELEPIQDSLEEATIENDNNRLLPVVKVQFNVLPHVEMSIYKYITGD